MTDNDYPLQRVLLTHDDGIDAPGLAVLATVAATLAREVWIVAPEHDQSGTSHSISLHAPLRVSRRGERRFGVVGTPGDCVVMALRQLMDGAAPDLVLSGVNRGGNLGVETVFSGTVGAAMTGMLMGVRSIALSQTFSDPSAVRWETAQALAPGAIRQLLGVIGNEPVCLNVNFPDVPLDRAGRLTPSTQGMGRMDGIDAIPHTDPRGIPYFWLRINRSERENACESETAVVANGGIAVTALRFERTDEDVYMRLRQALP